MAKRRKQSGLNNSLIWLGLGIIIIGVIYEEVPSLIYSTIGLIAAFFIIRYVVKWRRRVRWRHKVLSSGIHNIDVMKGENFEIYLKALFEHQGYKVELTPKSGDFGADLILSKSDTRTVVQAKRYDRTVGVDAIQQVTAARSHYGANEAIVITNQDFSPNARQLAQTNNIVLINRESLINLISRVHKSVKGTA